MKKLLPLLAIGSTAAIVTPLVTSCSKTIDINLEWIPPEIGVGGDMEAKHFVVAEQLYKVHVDTSEFEGDIDFSTNGFILIMSQITGEIVPPLTAPEKQQVFKNGVLIPEWKLVANTGTHVVELKTPIGAIEKGNKIDIEFTYKSTEEFEPFNCHFMFNRDTNPDNKNK